MKKIFPFTLTLVMALTISLANAQDQIFMMDGTKVEAKVLTIDKSSIKYVLADNPGGPEYFIDRKDALMILYENGSHEYVSTRVEIGGNKPFRRNVFTFHLFDLVYNNFTLSYERLSRTGMLGIQIPVTIGYGEVDIRDYQTVIASGVGLKFYPTGQGKWRYFMGPSLEAGIAKDAYYYYDFIEDGYDDSDYFFGRLMVDNGVMFMPIDNFSLSAVAGLGIRYLSGGYDPHDVRTTFQFSFNLGYRF